MYRVEVIRDYQAFAVQSVRVLVWEDVPGARRYAMDNGTWQTIQEGSPLVTGPVPTPGIVLPVQVIEPLALAIQEFQGHASHADTEARVLREWLQVEQARVDRALGGTS